MEGKGASSRARGREFSSKVATDLFDDTMMAVANSVREKLLKRGVTQLATEEKISKLLTVGYCVLCVSRV